MENTLTTNPTSVRASSFQPSIQGLRAVAVVLVLAFHVFPKSVTGGFVGVDVFFVISGYLISSLLLRELESTGTISLIRFYSRRLRRLLPAALTVLVLILLTANLLPEARVIDTTGGVIASLLSVENWRLLLHATDYLAADNAASPTQHYWSLSVEEQFYLVWPALILVVSGVFLRFKGRPAVKSIGVAFLVLTAVSLAYSIWLTSHSRSSSYFDSLGRVWELGLGGVLAVVNSQRVSRPGHAQILGIVGLVAIAWAAITFSGSTAFPGPWALLPVLGGALVLSVADQSTTLVNRLLSSSPFIFLGDISYSLYLYHWPLIVYFKARSDTPLTLVCGLVIVAVSVILAYLSKRFVEDGFRLSSHSKAKKSPGVTFAWSLSCVVLTTCGALAVKTHATTATIETLNGAAAAAGSDSFPGAAALLSGAEVRGSLPFLPSASAAPFDRSIAYTAGCIAKFGDSSVKECKYSTARPKKSVVLLGDSHALQWLPVLSRIAVERHWNFVVIAKVSCPFARVTVMTTDAKPFDECAKWGERARDRIIELKPDLVITTESRRYDPVGSSRLSKEATQAMVDGVAARWRSFLSNGSTVIAIADTPRMDTVVPDCMSRPSVEPADCSTSRAKALALPDPMILASRNVRAVRVLNFTNGICGSSVCSPVVGNVLVWMDSNHLTATYATTLKAEVQRQLDAR